LLQTALRNRIGKNGSASAPPIGRHARQQNGFAVLQIGFNQGLGCSGFAH
jgi:hypothetical protein